MSPNLLGLPVTLALLGLASCSVPEAEPLEDTAERVLELPDLLFESETDSFGPTQPISIDGSGEFPGSVEHQIFVFDNLGQVLVLPAAERTASMDRFPQVALSRLTVTDPLGTVVVSNRGCETGELLFDGSVVKGTLFQITPTREVEVLQKLPPLLGESAPESVVD